MGCIVTLNKIRSATGFVIMTAVLALLALIVPGSMAAEAESGPQLTLADAIRIAETQSPAVGLADLTLEEARTAYEEGKVNQILRPSVITLQQVENTWRAAQHNRELARQDLIMQVSQAYYEVLRTEMALELAERALAQSRAQLESTKVYHEQGMLSDVDLLAAESQAATAELDRNRAQANQITARMNLNRLLGRDLEAPFELIDQLRDVQPVPVDLETAVASALQNRVEVQRARDNVELRQKELQVNDNPYTPPLTIQKARLALERAELELKQREIEILLEVRQNYQSVIEAEARIPIQEKNATRAQESQRIAQIRYDAGLITSVDLIDAQRAAFQAEMQSIQAVFDYQIALARFSRSAGLSLEKMIAP